MVCKVLGTKAKEYHGGRGMTKEQLAEIDELLEEAAPEVTEPFYIGPITWQALLAMRTENARLMDLLQDVAFSGVEMEDPRIDYLCVQISESTWQEIWKLFPEANQ